MSQGDQKEQRDISEATNPIPTQGVRRAQRPLTWVIPATAGLCLGLGLGIPIGDRLPARFEKTAVFSIRFDTRTAQNCWAGPSSNQKHETVSAQSGDAPNPFDKVFDAPATLPTLPDCKDLLR